MKKGYVLSRGVSCRLPKLSDTSAWQNASADDLRVLLYLATTDYAASVEETAKALNVTLTRAAAGVEYWLSAGVLKPGDAEKTGHFAEEPLILGTAAEDAREIAERRLKDCLDACAAILGKLLNPAEINLLVGIITNYGVSESYLITLLDFSVNKLGVKGVKYTTKVATSLFEEGVRTDAALDEYIRRYELTHSYEGQVRRMFGLGERSLTKKETAMLGRWFAEYEYDMEIVGIAYDITVSTASRVTLSYADKILIAWHEAGLKTPEEIEAHLAREREARSAAKPAPKKKTTSQTSGASFDIGNFFESALNRSYGDNEKK